MEYFKILKGLTFIVTMILGPIVLATYIHPAFAITELPSIAYIVYIGRKKDLI